MGDWYATYWATSGLTGSQGKARSCTLLTNPTRPPWPSTTNWSSVWLRRRRRRSVAVLPVSGGVEPAARCKEAITHGFAAHEFCRVFSFFLYFSGFLHPPCGCLLDAAQRAHVSSAHLKLGVRLLWSALLAPTYKMTISCFDVRKKKSRDEKGAAENKNNTKEHGAETTHNEKTRTQYERTKIRYNTCC